MDQKIEYIVVRFDLNDIRQVIANGLVAGKTEHICTIPGGQYKITISGEGFTPPKWEGLISGTEALKPLVIHFKK